MRHPVRIATILYALLWACTGNHQALRRPRQPKKIVRRHVQCPSGHDKPMLAIVIDDMGRRPGEIDPFLDLRIPLTFSVFPCLPATRQVLNKIMNHGLEAWGHIPMEPEKRAVMEPDLQFLTTTDSTSEIRRKFKRLLTCLPGIRGINNHMGSAFTRDPERMKAVIEVLKIRGLAFLDSRTTPLTVAESTARNLHCPCLRRDIFLDDVKNPTAVKDQLNKAAMKARQYGCAVAIGHPFQATVRGISLWLGSPFRDLVRVVPASCLFSCPRFAGDAPTSGSGG